MNLTIVNVTMKKRKDREKMKRNILRNFIVLVMLLATVMLISCEVDPAKQDNGYGVNMALDAEIRSALNGKRVYNDWSTENTYEIFVFSETQVQRFLYYYGELWEEQNWTYGYSISPDVIRAGKIEFLYRYEDGKIDLRYREQE